MVSVCPESSYLRGGSRTIRSSRSFLATKQVQDAPATGDIVSTHQKKQKQERQNIDFAALFFSDCVLEINTGLYILRKSFLNSFVIFSGVGGHACVHSDA